MQEKKVITFLTKGLKYSFIVYCTISAVEGIFYVCSYLFLLKPFLSLKWFWWALFFILKSNNVLAVRLCIYNSISSNIDKNWTSKFLELVLFVWDMKISRFSDVIFSVTSYLMIFKIWLKFKLVTLLSKNNLISKNSKLWNVPFCQIRAERTYPSHG